MTLRLEQQRPLAPLTTLELGGAARDFARVETRADLVEALRWAEREGRRVLVLGGGSNTVIADGGLDALVLQLATRGLVLTRISAEHMQLRVEAGEDWQRVVDTSLEADLAGLECLTGIPGRAGATPIQNVGAYGQEVGESIVEVEVLDRASLAIRTLPGSACAFAYRDSRFKREPERFIVLSVTFTLTEHGAPSIRYAELQQALALGEHSPSLRQVADTVHALRARKSMILDPGDPNHRSAGSFFTNPIVTTTQLDEVHKRAQAQGLISGPRDLPTFAVDAGRAKLAAGWLVERAGFQKGERRGNVGLSTKHALCLVHHGAGTTTELLAFATEIESRVHQVFGVTLVREPVYWR